MKGEAYIYKTNGEVKHLTFDKMPPLEVLTNAVGGHIEVVPYWNKHKGQRCVAFCNEQGKLENHPYNINANMHWLMDRQVHVDDVLVGDVIVMMGDEEFMEAL